MRLFKEFRSPKVQKILSTFKNKSKYSARVFRNSTTIENETWTKMSAILPWVNEVRERTGRGGTCCKTPGWTRRPIKHKGWLRCIIDLFGWRQHCMSRDFLAILLCSRNEELLLRSQIIDHLSKWYSSKLVDLTRPWLYQVFSQHLSVRSKHFSSNIAQGWTSKPTCSIAGVFVPRVRIAWMIFRNQNASDVITMLLFVRFLLQEYVTANQL